MTIMKINKLLSRKRTNRNRGISLIEAAAGLFVAAMFGVALSRSMADNNELLQARNSAQKMSEVYEASKGYIAANHGALLSEMAINSTRRIEAGRANIGGAVPANSLQSEQLLPAGYIDRNPYGQRHALIVRKTAADRLEAIVTTYVDGGSGRQIPSRQLGKVAGYIGASGGYVTDINVDPADANRIVGLNGGWRSPIADWNAGTATPRVGTIQSTLAFDNGSVVSDYLYRNDVGVQSLNTMNTDIHMGNNDILDVDALTGTSKSIGGANARVVDVTGNVRASIDVWSRDVRASRNITAEGNVSADGNVTAGGNMTAQNMTASGTVQGAAVRSTGNLSVSGRADIGGNTDVKGTLTAGAIDPSMIVLNVGSGSILNNVTLKQLLPSMIAKNSYPVEPGTSVPKPRCNPGTPKIMVYKQNTSFRNTVTPTTTQIDTFDSVTARDQGADWWLIEWVGTDLRPGWTRTGIAQTYCSYE